MVDRGEVGDQKKTHGVQPVLRHKIKTLTRKRKVNSSTDNNTVSSSDAEHGSARLITYDADPDTKNPPIEQLRPPGELERFGYSY